MKCAGHPIAEECRILVGKLEGKIHFGGDSDFVRIILKQTFKKIQSTQHQVLWLLVSQLFTAVKCATKLSVVIFNT